MSARPPVAEPRPVNPPPAQASLAVWILREAVALLFVAGWLVLIAGELLTQSYTIPFWLHVVGVGVLAYALGINVADLTAFRAPPSPVAVAGQVVAQAVGRGEG